MGHQIIKGCSLERMIGYITEVNRIERMRFVVYVTRGQQSFFEIDDSDIFPYGEDIWRRMGAVGMPVGESFDPDWITELEIRARKRKEENFGLTSQVKLASGELMHIPMIDFRCLGSTNNFQQVIAVVNDLRLRGFVLESGKSYHFWGIDLLYEEEWRYFMERCKSYDIIGKHWPFYQLRDGFSALRVSTSLMKPDLPRVIAKIGDFEFEMHEEDWELQIF